MIKRALFAFFFLCTIISCQRDKTNEAKEFYEQVNAYLDLSEKHLNVLGDSTTAISQHLLTDPLYIPDTLQLRELVKNTLAVNRAITDSIQNLDDPEPSIGVKAAAINYSLAWNGMLENEYQTWIHLLGLKTGDKADQIRQLLEPPLKSIQESSDVLTLKNREFRKTYEF